MSEKELQISAEPKLERIASEDQKRSQFNGDNVPGKLGSSTGTIVSPDEQDAFVPLQPAFERGLRRIDWHLVPSISLPYWLLNLSSGQIGKARLFGTCTW